VYDVVYLDRGRRQQLVAGQLSREAACDLARQEARRRRVGRMFLAGSELGPTGELVVIVESQQSAA
jgi:hypothetical protein